MGNKIKNFLESIFGENYRTTIAGNLALICGAISVKPDLINWVPLPYYDYVLGVINIFTFVFGAKFAKDAADSKNVKSNTEELEKKRKPKVRTRPIKKTTKTPTKQ